MSLVIRGEAAVGDRVVGDGVGADRGGEGVVRDSVTRRLAHEPFGWRPTTLLVIIRRLPAPLFVRKSGGLVG